MIRVLFSTHVAPDTREYPTGVNINVVENNNFVIISDQGGKILAVFNKANFIAAENLLEVKDASGRKS